MSTLSVLKDELSREATEKNIHIEIAYGSDIGSTYSICFDVNYNPLRESQFTLERFHCN